MRRLLIASSISALAFVPLTEAKSTVVNAFQRLLPLFTQICAWGADSTCLLRSKPPFVSPVRSLGETGTAAAPWLKQGFLGLTMDVEGTGIAGMNMGSECHGNGTCGLFLRVAPSTPAGGMATILRLQRESSYSGGTPGNTAPALWVLDYTSPRQNLYELAILGDVHNQTAGANGAQNVGVLGQAWKQYKQGYDYGDRGTTAGQIGQTWGGNFNCTDLTGVQNPLYSCLGAEFDTVMKPGAGADANHTRVGVQISGAAYGGPALAGDHIGRLLMLSANPNITVDNGVDFTTARYQVGLDVARADIVGPALNLAAGQKIEFSGPKDYSGSLVRSLSYQLGALAYRTPDGVAFTISDKGDIGAKSLNAPLATPASSSAACTAGKLQYDTNYVYVCTAPNHWKRSALTDF